MNESEIQQLSVADTIVTVNRRLARILRERFDQYQVMQGRTAWESLDVLPWASWLERLRTRPGLLKGGGRFLDAMQEEALWQQAIRRHHRERMQVAGLARQARQAWNLAHAWRIAVPGPGAGSSIDVDHFARWSRTYQSACEGADWIDSARLPDLIREAPGLSALDGESVLLAGFSSPTPQQTELFTALADHLQITRLQSPGFDARVKVAEFAEPAQELECVGRWVAQRLQRNPSTRIAIVVPDLAARQSALRSALDDALDPGSVLPGRVPSSRAYNVSLGTSLDTVPVVAAALALLEFSLGDLPLWRAGALVRSPFLGGAKAELGQRALLDLKLRRIGEPEVDPAMVRFHAAPVEEGAAGCTDLAERLGEFRESIQSEKGIRLPSVWAGQFAALLTIMGWPGERELNSEEHQAVEAWRELLADLPGLDAVVDQIGRRQAIGWLRRLAGARVFQPASEPAPIQVLGVLEATGLRFDALWITGMHDRAWPPLPAPNPFLPIRGQREAGVPNASSSASLQLAQHQQQEIFACAPEVIVSSVLNLEGEPVAASPLLDGFPRLSGLDAPDAELFQIQVSRSARHTHYRDDDAPPVTQEQVRGGSGLFKAQSACAFQAFAYYRLLARAMDVAMPGLDAAERGTVVHDVLERVWMELGSYEGLCRHSDEVLKQLVERVVESVMNELRARRPRSLGGRFFAIESGRLVNLALDWLAMERRRSPFVVQGLESDQLVQAGGLSTRVRVDRVDELADGHRLLIDYKTGKVTPSHWFGERPRDPQLPLYSRLFVDIAGLAFARVNVREPGFRGIATDDGLLPGVDAWEGSRLAREQGDWVQLMEQWGQVLERLGAEFMSGRADVDPADYPTTCAYCELGGLCRIDQKQGW